MNRVTFVKRTPFGTLSHHSEIGVSHTLFPTPLLVQQSSSSRFLISQSPFLVSGGGNRGRQSQSRPRTRAERPQGMLLHYIIGIFVWGDLLARGGEMKIFELNAEIVLSRFLEIRHASFKHSLLRRRFSLAYISSRLAHHSLLMSQPSHYVRVRKWLANVSTLDRFGGLNWDKVVHRHQGWRLISCIWLHAGLIHLLVNMLSLVFIGIRLEQNFGFVRIGIIYLLSGFGGSVLSSLFIRNSISVGASGALCGLLGAMLAELITNWSIYTNKVAALLTLIVIILINLAVGILPHVDNFTHIGGFLTGVLLGFILLPRPQFGWLERHSRYAGARVTSKYKGYQYVLLVVSLMLLIAGFTVGLVMLFRGVNAYERCHWCRCASCVPTSKWKCEDT